MTRFNYWQNFVKVKESNINQVTMSDKQLSANPFHINPDLPEYEIFARLPCGLVVINAQGKVLWFNESAANLLGDGLAGARWLDVMNQAFAPRDDDGHEVSLVDGRRISVAISSLSNLPGELVTLTDLTTTRDYEHARANQERLATIGRMTAQLAHQLRTPLSSAMLYTEHLARHSSESDRNAAWIRRIEESHASIEQQIQDLLTFARGGSIEPVQVDLHSFANNLESKAQSLIAAHPIEFTFKNRLPASLHLLHEESLTGAILNLLNNSLQARAKHINIDLIYTKNSALLICVSDDGIGMSDEVKAQAFSPFFTTRAKGTGLGLAVVSAVVNAHHGEIVLDSSPDEGCCATITLPATKGFANE